YFPATRTGPWPSSSRRRADRRSRSARPGWRALIPHGEAIQRRHEPDHGAVASSWGRYRTDGSGGRGLPRSERGRQLSATGDAEFPVNLVQLVLDRTTGDRESVGDL